MNTKNLFQKIALFLLPCLLTAALFAQTTPPPKQWDKRFGGSSDDLLNSLQQTTDGGYILGGVSGSGISGDKTEDSRGSVDYWVVKIDANGVKQWDKRFGGSDYDGLLSLQQTTDGGYILGGTSYSGISGDKTEDNRGLYGDYWVVKIDANGIKQWDKRFGGTGYDNFYSLQQTTDGGYILGGYSNSGVGGDKTEDNWGPYYTGDYWVVKIDANGIKQWDKRFGGSERDYMSSLQQTPDGGYVLGGSSESGISGDKTEGSRGLSDYWVVKIDANGIMQWDKRFGGSIDDGLNSLKRTMDGDYILGGYSYSSSGGDKTQPNWDSSGFTSDYWVVKIDSNGIKQWDKRFGGSEFERGGPLQQTTDGRYISGGYSQSGISGDKTEDSRGSNDYWVVKLGCPPAAVITAMGNLDICTTGSVILKVNATDTLKYQWLKNGLKINSATKGYYKATVPGTYNVVVYTDTPCRKISNPLKVIKSCGPVASVSNGSSISTFNFQLSTFSVAPNPSKGNIAVTYNSALSGEIQLNVFDITGKKLFTKTVQAIAGNNNYQLNLSTLTAGVYNN